ncbi:CdaR family transcriptional regulator [Pseudonocardia sp. ICBG1142]|uniref:PucR family transcriptional regulator n=1 Tax=Pseudonocardia sp. ICBG1142 TaxID=2846760 RepID=UPI001CF6CBDD|nr:helix-turn-helix domain-containing protein [Pseudonocardia sp. ICBG1142]
MAVSGGGPALGLENLLGVLGGDFVEVVHAPLGVTIPVSAIVIADTVIVERIERGDLVLGIGVHPASPEAEAAIDGADPGIVFAYKVDSDAERAALRALAERHGATVLAVSPEMSWNQLHALARTAVSAAVATVPDQRGVPFGDLFALANSAAAALEGPVIVDDERMEVVAFSSLGDPIDEIRQQSILQRRPPREFLDWCESTGTLPRVRQSLRPVRVVPPDGAVRLVTAIRAGSDILGYVWVAESKRELDQHSEDLLAEIARLAAVQMLRSRISEDLDRRVRGDLLRSALDGRGDTAVLESRLGIGTSRFRLLAFATDAQGGRAAGGLAELRPLEDLVALRVEASRRRGVATSRQGRVYAVLPSDDGPDSDVAALAEQIVGQAGRQLHLDVRAAVSGEFPRLDELGETRCEVERLLNTPLLDDSRRVVSFDDSVAHAVLSELTEVMLQRPRLLQGGVAAMVVSDRDRGTEFLPSLRAYFDACGDLTAAAKTLFVHRNTLKYRLTRIRDAFGVDVDDPAQRLVAELQTSVFAQRPELRAALPAVASVPD